MFYPGTFPARAGDLSPKEVMELEFSAVWTLIAGDRAFARSQGTNLVPSLADEMVCLGLASPDRIDDVTALLAANERPLSQFVAERLSRPMAPEDWEWLTPDWDRVREYLGEESCREWQEKVAEEQRRHAAIAAPAA